MRSVPTKINIILDGNSIPNSYSANLVTQLDSLYGAGNYDYTMIAVGGQTIDNGAANCMQGRINQFLINAIKGFAVVNVLLFQEIRNEMFVNGSTPAQAVAKAKIYCQTVRAALPSICNLKIGHIIPIADDDTGANITTARGLILADTSGDWDFAPDLWGYSDAGGSFSNPLSGFYDADGTHLNNTGKTAAGNFLGTSVHTLYP